MRRDRLIKPLVRNSGNGRARGILRVWPLWERLAHHLWPTVPVPNGNGLFELHFRRHKGEPIDLPDGSRIVPGDWLGELHFDNQVFMKTMGTGGSEARTGSEKFGIIGPFNEQLQAVAAWIASGTIPHPIRGVVGITVLGRGAVRVGFTMRPRGGRILPKLDKLFVDGLMIIYTPEGVGRMTRGKTVHDPSQEAWMSVGELLRRHGSAKLESGRP